MSTCPHVHLSTCPPVHMSTCPPVHLSTCPHNNNCVTKVYREPDYLSSTYVNYQLKKLFICFSSSQEMINASFIGKTQIFCLSNESKYISLYYLAECSPCCDLPQVTTRLGGPRPWPWPWPWPRSPSILTHAQVPHTLKLKTFTI